MRILASDGIDKSAKVALEGMGHEVVEQFYEVDELNEQVKNFDVLVVRSATKVRKPTLDAAKAGGKLKMVIRAGVGIDNIDADYAKEVGIQVKNTPRASSLAVAELALGHMFSVARFIGIANATIRNDQWNKKEYKGIELEGKTIGIIGYGRIGQTLGKKCKALGMNVVAYDIFHVEGINDYVEMDELFAKADFISVHTPSINGEKLIRKENIDKMKDGVIIINTSRGDNLNEADLLEALNSGKVGGAGLDVWADEKNYTASHDLYSHPHVSCTPHIGAQTKEAQKRIGAEIVEIIKAM